MKVGDAVRITHDIYQEPCEEMPGGYLAYKGDVVLICRIIEGSSYPYKVKDARGDRFGVTGLEIQEIP